MVYQYVAYRENGEIVKGRLAATNEESASDLLSYAGYRAISLKRHIPFLSSDRMTAQFFPTRQSDIILFYRQLALLLESGINIVTSLELLLHQTDNRLFKKVMTDIISDLRSGAQLSVAMGRHPEVFANIHCRSLSVGEQTGSLETMLKQIADYMEKEIKAKKSVKGALTYPAIAGVVTLVVVGVMITFVLPAFRGLYGDLGAQLPTITRVMLDSGDFMKANGLYVLLGIVSVCLLGFIYTKTPSGKYRWNKISLTMPPMGRINHLNELSRICRSIALLFHAGLPLTEIMPLIIQGSDNKAMAQSLTSVQHDMLKGEGLSQPMSRDALFLPMMVQMVKVGEETGSLDTTLNAVAQNYETEAEDKTKSLIALIQPAMTIVIAIVVGFIALSLVSAMYSMYGQAF